MRWEVVRLLVDDRGLQKLGRWIQKIDAVACAQRDRRRSRPLGIGEKFAASFTAARSPCGAAKNFRNVERLAEIADRIGLQPAVDDIITGPMGQRSRCTCGQSFPRNAAPTPACRPI